MHASPATPSDAGRELVFYDGGCGMCHRGVHFVAVRDRDGAFAFAPLGGETFLAAVGETERARLPDSIVVRTADGRTLVRSAAAIHILSRLHRGWRFLAAIGRIVPRPVRDFLYDRVAAVRKRVFAAPKTACPILPPHLRARFLA
jgi:predicted DCC family thiol-disulfide oxidoreductase YuxK